MTQAGAMAATGNFLRVVRLADSYRQPVLDGEVAVTLSASECAMIVRILFSNQRRSLLMHMQWGKWKPPSAHKPPLLSLLASCHFANQSSSCQTYLAKQTLAAMWSLPVQSVQYQFPGTDMTQMQQYLPRCFTQNAGWCRCAKVSTDRLR